MRQLTRDSLAACLRPCGRLAAGVTTDVTYRQRLQLMRCSDDGLSVSLTVTEHDPHDTAVINLHLQPDNVEGLILEAYRRPRTKRHDGFI